MRQKYRALFNEQLPKLQLAARLTGDSCKITDVTVTETTMRRRGTRIAVRRTSGTHEASCGGARHREAARRGAAQPARLPRDDLVVATMARTSSPCRAIFLSTVG